VILNEVIILLIIDPRSEESPFSLWPLSFSLEKANFVINKALSYVNQSRMASLKKNKQNT
jgi:hypothetical protein